MQQCVQGLWGPQFHSLLKLPDYLCADCQGVESTAGNCWQKEVLFVLNLVIFLFLCTSISLNHFINALCNKTLQVFDWHLNSVTQLFVQLLPFQQKYMCFIHILSPWKSNILFPVLTASSHDFPLLQSRKKRTKSSWNGYGAAACCTISIQGREQLPLSKTYRFPQQRIIFVSLHCCFFHHSLCNSLSGWKQEEK